MGKTNAGLMNGLLGVVIFSGSLPATRVAVADFDPVFLTVARALIAAFLAAGLLLALGASRPARQQLGSLALVALGVVVGFPLLTAFALQSVTSAHSIVFVAMLPLCTALFAVLRAGERPPAAFWAFSALGAALVVAFAVSQGFAASPKGDLLMVAAILVCGLGYAEGARLSRTLGGWQVICWALLIALPVTVPLAIYAAPASWNHVGGPAWLGLAYVSIFSMLVAFFFWYRGLAQGGIAAIGQLQLLQPFFGLALAAAILREDVGWPMIGATVAVALCVAAARRSAA